MIWFHLLRMRRALGYKPFRWILKAFCITLCALVFAAYWWIASSVIHDQQVQASHLRIDVLILPKAGFSQVQQCARSLQSSEGVLVARVLDSHAVWSMFQQELGMQAGGLTDLASMPTVVQIQLRPDSASLTTAESIRTIVKARFSSIVDRVLIPAQAFIDCDRRRTDVASTRLIGLSILGFVILLASFWLSSSFANAILAVRVSTTLGKGSMWGLSSVALLTLLVSIFAIALGFGCCMLVSESVVEQIGWLLPFLDLFRV